MSKYVGKIITNQAPAGYSVFFDGSGDDLSIATNTAFADLPGDFTIECWFYTGSTSVMALAGTSVFNSSGYFLELNYSGAGRVSFVPAPFGNRLETASSVYSTNTWNHIAYVRSGTTVTIYVNGTSVVSGTRSVTANTQPLTIGQAGNGWDARYYFNGYISNFRIVKGTALYTAAFTPPTQLLRITNTSLLTCNSPAIVDQSSNAFAITVNGNSAVSTFTPFTAYVPYNPALGASTPGVWTLDEAMQAAATRQWNMYDPNFQNTTLLLHGNGTNGAQNNTFLDSSSNNFTITRNGNTTQGSFSPFSQTGWGLRTNDRSYLTIPASSDFDLISTDFTVEFWFNLNALNNMAYSGSSFFGNGLATAVNGWALGTNDSGSNPATEIKFTTWQAGSAATNTFSGLTLNFGTWYHVVLQRNGAGSGNLRLFINGVQQGAAQTANTYSSAGSTFTLGSGAYTQNATYSGNADYYISNVRLTKSAVYSTSGFTPPTSNLSALGATTLLICQSNRFVNNGTNTGAITSTSWTSTLAQIVPFSPFYPTAAYTPATIGGSGYFDGTGDYLQTASGASTSFGTGDFCVECWFYKTSSAATGGYLVANLESNSDAQWALMITSTGLIRWQGWNTVWLNPSAPAINQWNHVAVCRSGTTLSMFVNGSRAATATNSNNYSATTNVRVGAYASGTDPITGYISSARVVKGSSVYDPSLTTYTVPTAPLTAITNTSLLLNFTNAGIVDSTAKNVLETVGNAQISTTQSKFGGSSMYFDGAGDNLVVGPTPLLNFGVSDFTIEFWIYPANFSAVVYPLYSTSARAKTDVLALEMGTGGTIVFYATASGGGVWSIASAATMGTLTVATWNHIALVRNGSSFRGYVNGVQSASLATNSSALASFDGFNIGTNGAGGGFLNGYMDDIRITRFARYTAAFTPQTSQWQDQ